MLLPNVLTVFRVLLIPLMIAAYIALPVDHAIWAASLFVLAAITDGLDGYLARSRNQISNFGAFLDPVADKLLVMSAGVLIVHQHHSWWISIPVIVIIGREITISALREWMALLGKGVKTKVRQVAKFKTAMQLVAMALLLASSTKGGGYQIGLFCLYIAMILTLYSMIILSHACKK